MAVDLFSIGKFTIHGYGLMIGLGFLVAVLLGSARAKKEGLSPDHFMNIALWVLIIGFAGGKLLNVIVCFKQFLSDPLSVLGSEGFVVYGGIITGILSIYVYCHVKKIPFLDYFDIFATFVPINQAFGRLGCLMAGCCYGRRTDSWFGIVFPEGSFAPAGVKLLPTQIMMAVGDLLIFFIVYMYDKNKKIKGTSAVVYLLSYSIGRFIIEFFRNDERGAVGVLSTSQFIAIFSALFAIGLLVFLNKKAPRVELGGEQIQDKSEN